MNTVYLVEKNFKKVRSFDEEATAISFAKEIDGIAWKHKVWKDTRGSLWNEFLRYDNHSGKWVH